MFRTPTGQPHGRVTNPLVATTPEVRTPSEMDLPLKRTMPQVTSPAQEFATGDDYAPTLERTLQGHITTSEASSLAKWPHSLVHLKLGKMLKWKLRLFRNNGLKVLSWFHQGTHWNITFLNLPGVCQLTLPYNKMPANSEYVLCLLHYCIKSPCVASRNVPSEPLFPC